MNPYSNMKVAVIGSGGREHALAWKLQSSPSVTSVSVIPGNGGTSPEIRRNLEQILNQPHAIIDFCRQAKYDLVVVGPDSLACSNLADLLRAVGIRTFGPSARAALIEKSKAHGKQLMRRAGIPTAPWTEHTSIGPALEAASRSIAQHGRAVVKACGLMAGKGVTIAETAAEAEAVIVELFVARDQQVVLIERPLDGVEVSVHALCDGSRIQMLPLVADHKRAKSATEGAMTGGMGTLSPAPAKDGALEEIERCIVRPMVEQLRQDGTPFRGMLFPGVMLTDVGPFAIEWNARWGDPETQTLVRTMGGDLGVALASCADGHLRDGAIWHQGAAATVIVATDGYPQRSEPAGPIEGIGDAESDPAVIVFHSGTELREKEAWHTGARLGTYEPYATGGRAVGVSANGRTPQDAVARALAGAARIRFPGAWHRADIGRGLVTGGAIDAAVS